MESSCFVVVALGGSSCFSSVVVLCVWLELPYKRYSLASQVQWLLLWLSESVEERKFCCVLETKVGADRTAPYITTSQTRVRRQIHPIPSSIRMPSLSMWDGWGPNEVTWGVLTGFWIEKISAMREIFGRWHVTDELLLCWPLLHATRSCDLVDNGFRSDTPKRTSCQLNRKPALVGIIPDQVLFPFLWQI